MPTLATIEKTIWNQLEKIENIVEREVKANYVKALDSIRVELSKIYERYAEKGVLTKAQMTKYNRLTGLQKRLAGILRVELGNIDKALKNFQKVQYQESFFRHAWGIDQAVGVNVTWGMINEVAVANSVARFEDPAHAFYEIAIQDLKETSRRRLQRDITQGLIRGDSYPKMARAVKETMTKSYGQAMRIARTEGQRAAVEGQQAQYNRAREKGIDIVDVWDATRDNRTRPEHGKLDGVPAKLDENGNRYWNTDVGRVSGPLQSGVASFDIHCRCRVRGDVQGIDAPEFKSPRARAAYKPEKYSEWAKRKGITRNKYGQEIGG